MQATDPVTVIVLMMGTMFTLLMVGIMAGMVAAAIWFHRYLQSEKREELALEERRNVLADEVPQEMKDEAVMRVIDRVRNQDTILKTAWAEEKLEEGWTEDDIAAFLEARPEIELN